jgi:short-subunit dehydrogenase
VTLLARGHTALQTAASQIEAEVGCRPAIIACDLATTDDLSAVLSEVGPADILDERFQDSIITLLSKPSDFSD